MHGAVMQQVAWHQLCYHKVVHSVNKALFGVFASKWVSGR